jgi:hypothetical protein
MNEETNEKLRKFLLPGAASVIGAGAGLVLSRSGKLKDALPSLNGAGIGDLAEDLRSKIGSVAGTSQSRGGSSSSSESRSQSSRSQSGSRRSLNANELEKRQRERQQRRKQRAGR